MDAIGEAGISMEKTVRERGPDAVNVFCEVGPGASALLFGGWRGRAVPNQLRIGSAFQFSFQVDLLNAFVPHCRALSPVPFL